MGPICYIVAFNCKCNHRMNPLGIEPDRFTVATDEQGRLLGFGQLEPKDGCFELRSMVVDASHR